MRPISDPDHQIELTQTQIPLKFVPDESMPEMKLVQGMDESEITPQVFQAEKILNSRTRLGVEEFLVKWAGYPKKKPPGNLGEIS